MEASETQHVIDVEYNDVGYNAHFPPVIKVKNDSNKNVMARLGHSIVLFIF